MGRQAEGPWPNAEQLSICDYAQDVPLAPHNVRLHEDFEFEERVFGDGDAILIWLQTWQPACRLTANDPKRTVGIGKNRRNAAFRLPWD
jgi:hypothetical protein